MAEIFFKITAILILAAFYGCYVLKMIMQRRKGIKTDQMGKGKAGAARAIEIVMKIANYVVPLVQVFSLVQLKNFPPAGFRFAGIVLGLTGDVIFIISVATMKDNWRAGVSETDKTKLVIEGIYRFSRNPAFLGFDLFYAGIVCMYFNWWLFAASVFAAVMFELQIVFVEEKFLLRTFGEEYAEYKRQVNRYFGRKISKMDQYCRTACISDCQNCKNHCGSYEN